MKQASYREFTSHFLNTLKNQRNQFFRIVNATEGETSVKDMLVELLKDNPNGYAYADFINEHTTFRLSYRKLRNIDQSLSQSSFEQAVDEIKTELDGKFEKHAQKAQNLTMLMSIMKDMIKKEEQNPQQSQIKIPVFLDKSQKDSKPINRDDSKNDIFKKNNSKPEIEIKPQPSRSNKQLKPNPKSEEPIIQKKQNKKEQPVKKAEGRKSIQIDSSKLSVQVRYLHTLVDYQNYIYNKAKLKDSLQAYIKKYLKENMITVLTQSPQVRIMDDTNYIKSKEAGNYRFNPFCDVIEIYLKMKDKSSFNYDFRIIGKVDQVQITSSKLGPNEWNKNLMNLSPKSPISELVQYICNKRQAKQLIDPLTNGLRDLGGANTIQDLYGWERSDYSSLHIKPTFIFQIQQLIEQIKDNSQVGSGEKSLNDKKKQCIKIANSHKILRYAVYSVSGPSGVKNVAWLNMQNLKTAIQIVREEIYNKELLDQLDEYFNQFALNPDDNPIAFSRGLVLYGPPGTGKTVLTEALPNIIGFHLIEKGLSAADFMKSLVGESSRMIRDLVNRAAVSPYLLCSVGIDEVDGLVPDRKDKDEKNKGEGISMLLSVIGGNKDVSNLVFMTSTNYLKKIDQAIRRRLSGQYQVGRPNPWARQQIMIGKLKYLKERKELLIHAIKITTNFTGAAIGSLANFLLKSLKIKVMDGKVESLTIQQITDAAILIARQFSIKLGVYTLPEIYNSQTTKKFMFSESFLQKISNHFMIIKYANGNDYNIMYATETQRYFQGKVTPFYEKEDDKISIPVDKKNDLDAFVNYIETIFPKKKYQIVTFRSSSYTKYSEYKRDINNFLLESEQARRKNRKIVLIVQDYKGYEGAIRFDAKLFERNHHNLYTFFYLLSHQNLKDFSAMAFGDWKSREEMQKQGSGPGHENYSGRIMVELTNETRMAFELNSAIESESKVTFRLFLRSEENTSPKAVIPELVDFFTRQEVSYILLIDYELLLQNDAFEEKKVLQVMEEKMMEAKNYERVAVIINLDSMVMLSESASDSSMGRSMSYSIQNHNLYQIILNYMREFAIISGKTSRWMTVIAKHPQLIKIVKGHLDWPLYPEQIQKKREEEAKDEEKKCVRCGIIFTERENEEERKCMQHPGSIIDTRLKIFDNSSPEELKARKYKQKQRSQRAQRPQKAQKNNEDDRYVYACCLKGLNEQGCRNYYHIEESQLESMKDQLENQKLNSDDKWNKVLGYFK